LHPKIICLNLQHGKRIFGQKGGSIFAFFKPVLRSGVSALYLCSKMEKPKTK